MYSLTLHVITLFQGRVDTAIHTIHGFPDVHSALLEGAHLAEAFRIGAPSCATVHTAYHAYK
ncbi:MAG: hypothetical protein A3D65_05930 [Candidatus Lloydbacteria bacterium RIFCSPHIGHO2_02_FULL_50_13]|uniref:Uncharacterized protein n=1 Tax=Candidatus Lloydbacteria bacterium RIFCSPHIGHO2_02_FULL_50_13 TaxID=1798661 RepID=A0A1G2D3J9_9BACT|nr:MAG: hypothetical protein A3D65_05930 [Candidatus Lloydbacteria bacterium RIFCSPHIGHO2_02_FULL_50_13]